MFQGSPKLSSGYVVPAGKYTREASHWVRIDVRTEIQITCLNGDLAILAWSAKDWVTYLCYYHLILEIHVTW